MTDHDSSSEALTTKQLEAKLDGEKIAAKVQMVVVGTTSYRREGTLWVPYDD